MEARLSGIDLQEALRYLGSSRGQISPELRADLERCAEQVQKLAKPRAVWRLFELLPDLTLAGSSFRPQGQSIREHLRDCRRVVLMASTLGAELEQLLRRSQLCDMSDAVLLDACASTAIENVCDNLCLDLAAELAPASLTDRFSPGYGDFPLAQQRDLFRLLQPERLIGLTLSESGLMIPQKSVTALIGVSERPLQRKGRSCDDCSFHEHCTYRKEGTFCAIG